MRLFRDWKRKHYDVIPYLYVDLQGTTEVPILCNKCNEKVQLTKHRNYVCDSCGIIYLTVIGLGDEEDEFTTI